MKPDTRGSAWGAGYDCGATPEKVRRISHVNRRVLGELGLYFDSVVSMKDLVSLLAENVPVLYEGIGNSEIQGYYEKGLKILKNKYELM